MPTYYCHTCVLNPISTLLGQRKRMIVLNFIIDIESKWACLVGTVVMRHNHQHKTYNANNSHINLETNKPPTTNQLSRRVSLTWCSFEVH